MLVLTPPQVEEIKTAVETNNDHSLAAIIEAIFYQEARRRQKERDEVERQVRSARPWIPQRF